MQILFFHLRQSKVKNLLYGIATILLSGILFFSCKKVGIVIPPPVNAPLAISSSDSSLVLNQVNQNAAAVTFNWTTGTNKGTNSAIDYTFQLDKKGNNFANPVSMEMGRQVYTLSYTTAQLNDSVLKHWNITPGTAVDLEARIVANVAGTSLAQQISNIKGITVTPYKPVSSTLYIVGDATANGLNAGTADSLTRDPLVPGLFHYQGTLTAGHFKFITTLGSLLPSYNEGTDSNHIILRQSNSDPDNQFVISNTSVYEISVNLITLTIGYTPAALPLFKELWIVGDATPNGWNINVPNKMFVDVYNPFVFRYNEVLNVGEFKIPTALGNWNGDYYRPLTNDPSITDTTATLVLGNTNPPDNKWKISTAGPYKIELNISTNSIHITPFTPYTSLWMVGDATPVGWNINTPQPMVPTPGDPYTFTYSGPLTVGEFKIPVTTGNFNCPYFRPATNHPPISDSSAPYVPVNEAPADVNDYKWYISVAGNYKVTLNQLYETISIVKQ